ncbi:hypothetical protein [Roseomonas harenae]|uniref:hypothetical protein n=1 Tax=Muricoccus harenae TaxID=2692566 RepID=UPI0013316679|nr:hypothetical protein [Roseomonas harenae]
MSRPVPAAVVVVSVPPGRPEALRPFLASLGRSRGAGELPVAPGALAVLILSPDAQALSITEALAPDCPFPLRVEQGAGDAAHAVRRAMAWADRLGVAGAPVLLAAAEQPVAPRWAYGLLGALRDGADLVTHRRRLRERLTGLVSPIALSARAQWLMERRLARGGPKAGSPWNRPGGGRAARRRRLRRCPGQIGLSPRDSVAAGGGAGCGAGLATTRLWNSPRCSG